MIIIGSINDENRLKQRDSNIHKYHQNIENIQDQQKDLKQTEDSSGQHNLENIEEAISIIPEVDESNFTTDEKFKKRSPNLWKIKRSKKQEELDKIPFDLEEEPKNLKFHIADTKRKILFIYF